jgi:hypothetical protein
MKNYISGLGFDPDEELENDKGEYLLTKEKLKKGDLVYVFLNGKPILTKVCKRMYNNIDKYWTFYVKIKKNKLLK